MKSKILSMLNTTKKKVGAIVLCGTLVTAIGAGTAFAASTINTLQVKMENGIRTYSADGGKTWSKDTPDNVVVDDKDGKITIWNGIPPKDGEQHGMLSKVENGVGAYSSDGGKTWSETAPAGAEDSKAFGIND